MREVLTAGVRPGRARARRARAQRRCDRRVVVAGAVLWGAVVLRLALWPRADLPQAALGGLTRAAPAVGYPVAEVAGNVLLYLPLGVLLTVAGALPRAVPLAAATVSVCCELVQRSMPGRVPSVLDVGANVCGAVLGAIGAAAGRAAVRWARRRRGEAP